jgi:hypothetical protein
MLGDAAGLKLRIVDDVGLSVVGSVCCVFRSGVIAAAGSH